MISYDYSQLQTGIRSIMKRADMVKYDLEFILDPVIISQMKRAVENSKSRNSDSFSHNGRVSLAVSVTLVAF